jgi:hypothetical protein
MITNYLLVDRIIVRCPSPWLGDHAVHSLATFRSLKKCFARIRIPHEGQSYFTQNFLGSLPTYFYQYDHQSYG